MAYLVNKEKCTGCSACVSVCPKSCLKIVRNVDGFCFPQFVTDKCVNCGVCQKICPVINPKESPEQITMAYAAFTKDSNVRMQSSSGGIFSEISVEMLNQGGVVYGAAHDNQFRVIHKCIKNNADLPVLRGAKYAQSDLGNCFLDVQERLKNGQQVLFSGTPCQVAGLKSFLQQDYDELLCVDFVCHGIPSPMVWEKYVQYRAHLDNNNVFPKHINLRSKESGWSRYSYSVAFDYADGKRYISSNGNDAFMRLFVGDYILRESCSNCQFKGYDRVSDITLGDFWGIWDVAPAMDDNKGTSLVLVHSSKGEDVLKSISDKIKYKQVTLEEASRMNPSLLKSSVHQPGREKMLNVIAENGFQAVLPLVSTQDSKKKTVLGTVKQLIKKSLKFH